MAEITTVTYTPDEIRIFGEDNDYKALPCTIDSSVTEKSVGTPMGKVTATGKYKPFDKDASDGTEAFVGFLANTVNPAGEPGGARDVGAILWITGYFDLAKVTALGWNAEALASRTGAWVVPGNNILVLPG